MKNYITTFDIFEYLAPINIKKEILFFDKVLLLNGNLEIAESLIKSATKEGEENFYNNLKTIDFLIDRGLCEKFSFEDGESIVKNSEKEKDPLSVESTKSINKITELKIMLRKGTEILGEKENTMSNIQMLYNLFNQGDYVDARFWALLLASVKDEIYYPIIKKDIISNHVVEKKQEVTNFLFNKIPVLDPNSSWEEILEYKSDKDAQRKYYALINWVNEMSISNMSTAEIKDKFEHLYREYEHQLNLHKKKKSTTTFQVVVNAPLEAIENLVKLRFSKILSPFFDVTKAEMDLLEAETKITGRELGYIFDVNEKLGKK